MGTLKVIVRNDALNFMQEVTHWYEFTMGRKAAQKFTDDIRNTISTLSRFPGIGTLEHNRSTATTKYYSFLSHPKYRIIYRFTKTTLYIVAIHATMMKYK